MRTLDEFLIGFRLTLALVFVTRAGDHTLHFSEPMTVIVVGLSMNNHGARCGTTEAFWRYIEVLIRKR